MKDSEWINLYFDGESFYKDSLSNMNLVDKLPTSVLIYLTREMGQGLAPIDPRIILTLCDRIESGESCHLCGALNDVDFSHCVSCNQSQK